ncbi:cation efflux family-domain-containing protein [Pyronema omphalodes]|nr:cation efflux family-domain-containing protein [Pyronema omphalodes]
MLQAGRSTRVLPPFAIYRAASTPASPSPEVIVSWDASRRFSVDDDPPPRPPPSPPVPLISPFAPPPYLTAMPSRPAPLPIPIQSVEPPTPIERTGQGIEDLPTNTSDAHLDADVDAGLLSPMTPSFPPSVSGPLTESSNASPRRSSIQIQAPQPFNFKPMVASKGPVSTKPNQRRGHKYKHSSVSHQIFLEPPPRAPLSLPASLPMPTWRELYRSISPEQSRRSLWSLTHLFIAGFTLFSASGSLALTALSHLIMFDALGAALCVAVDVLSNFEVWKRSSIRHPFGLERAEVLAGFAMSVFLLFMGFDIISHCSEHLMEGMWKQPGGHEHSHGGHGHAQHKQRVPPGGVDVAALAALIATLVSAILLKNHARIGKAMQFATLSHLPSILSNPSHLLTIACSSILLLQPLLSLPQSNFLDSIMGLSIAVSMIAIGVRLVKVLGSMLLMSHNGGSAVPSVIAEISSDPGIREVQEARFWQAHHGLCIATLKLVVGKEVEEAKMREKIARLVRERLGGNVKGPRWEVSIAISAFG